MPRVVDPAKIAYAAELYAAGKSFREAATEVGMDAESLRRILHRRGVVARPAGGSGWNRLPAPEGVAEQYAAGASELALAGQYGVARGVIRRWLTEAAVPIRGRREASLVRVAQTTPEQRAAQAAAAHAAVRGGTRSDEAVARTALGKERSGYGGRTSPGADWLHERLTTLGIEHVREKAVGRYNLDLAFTAPPVAVEVLGGNWHGSKPIHAVRTPYILNAGWHIVFVWDLQRCKVGPGALDYLVAFVEQSRLNPSAVREYRVIRGDGQLLATGKADDDQFPLVPPSVRGLDGR